MLLLIVALLMLLLMMPMFLLVVLFLLGLRVHSVMDHVLLLQLEGLNGLKSE